MMAVRKRILVVDDDEDLSRLVKFRLEAFGYEVEIANNGKQAIASIRRERPAVVLLDLEMPEKNGLTTLYELKQEFDIAAQARSAKKRIPVIVVTGMSGDFIKEAVMGTGVFDYVRKPFNSEVLAEKIAKAIGEEL